MELTAALEAVRSLPGPLVVVSDSKYVVDCFLDRWCLGWGKKNWKRKGEPIPNVDLWRPLIDAVLGRGEEVNFEWVRGHDGDPMNDVVDRLAVEAATAQAGRSGDGAPTGLGPADQPSPRRAGGVALPAAPFEVPEGHRVVVLGLKPPGLGGYDENPVAAEVQRRLTEILVGLHVVHPDLVVLTGLGLGAEQLGAAAAKSAGVDYVAVLAFPNPAEKWTTASVFVYRRLLAGSAATLTWSDSKPASKQQAGIAMSRRDDWLISIADGALVVWDHLDASVARAVTALERRVPDDLWVITPPDTRGQ